MRSGSLCCFANMYLSKKTCECFQLTKQSSIENTNRNATGGMASRLFPCLSNFTNTIRQEEAANKGRLNRNPLTAECRIVTMFGFR
mmetsp:Transcript_105741/g.225716  ORF Transcript_105741/g.225716 Transcript_105741/m.225716 type:complete len:86 (+) Transcript_105741:33-290(+)